MLNKLQINLYRSFILKKVAISSIVGSKLVFCLIPILGAVIGLYHPMDDLQGR
jgi:hypothetical protein